METKLVLQKFNWRQKEESKDQKVRQSPCLSQLKVDGLCSETLKSKSYFDAEGFRTLSHASFFEQLKHLIMDTFQNATKETVSTIAKSDECDSAQSFKSVASNNNQRSTENLRKNEGYDKILKPHCEKLGELKLGELMLVKKK